MKSVLVSLLLLLATFGCDPPTDDPPKKQRTGLPAGAPLDGDIDELAATLVPLEPEDPAELRATAVRDALLELGYGIRLREEGVEGGFVLAYDDRPQGIVFEEVDTRTLGVALAEGVGVGLDDYMGVLAAFANELDNPVSAATLRAAFLDDLAVAAASDDDAIRANAQMIVALGRQAPLPFDLLDRDVDGGVALDALQLALITFPLSVELWRSVRNPDGSERTQGLTATQALDGPLPCTMTDTEGLIQDGVAAGTQLQWGLILDHLGPVAERFANATSLANAALVYAKLVWTTAVFQMDMTATPATLVRQIDGSLATPGRIDVNARLDGTGKGQIVNCLRTALNLANIDVSLPQDGPLAGKIIEWRNESKGQDFVVRFAAGSGDTRHAETDGDGNAHIELEGVTPRSPSIPAGAQTVKVLRRPVFRAFTNLKHNSMAQDLIDASAGLGGLGALVTMPAEMLNRFPLLFNKAITIPVEDMVRVEGDIFTIVGEFLSETGVELDNFAGVERQYAIDVRDRFEATIEVKAAPNGTGTGRVLGWQDTQTGFTDDYDDEYIIGKLCTQTQAPEGKLEVFTKRGGGEVGVQTSGDLVAVAVFQNGVGVARGWRYASSDEDDCPSTVDEPSRAQESPAYVVFDNTGFTDVGSSITVAAAPWTYTITWAATP